MQCLSINPFTSFCISPSVCAFVSLSIWLYAYQFVHFFISLYVRLSVFILLSSICLQLCRFVSVRLSKILQSEPSIFVRIMSESLPEFLSNDSIYIQFPINLMSFYLSFRLSNYQSACIIRKSYGQTLDHYFRTSFEFFTNQGQKLWNLLYSFEIFVVMTLFYQLKTSTFPSKKLNQLRFVIFYEIHIIREFCRDRKSFVTLWRIIKNLSDWTML